ncbi:Uncharacterised protein [Pannonibacter phragmitetus]|uniref:MobA/VirD2-like nuclease domain-containing protein n=1 Tax=Pannonibacter phragmitetus TaxID=121719 RepID=A0A378ZXH0_9HYPH|nr:hypothetical protein [Pannonibacter phragmitetus]SUB01922.1 Uncharacterised protein [Pannonibacter phragmitetus]
MIAGAGRHARTQRESRALVAHLLKDENFPRVRVLGGTLATDLPGVVRDMERLRDASKADAAALHIFLSPSRAMSDDELARAAEIVIGHFGAEGHPAGLVFHDKKRRDGDGHSHAHLVLGRVSPSGTVLESGFERIKIETAARIIEHELGEEPTLGRHHKSAVKWLRQHGRSDVADWLEAAHGPDPDKPRSAASPEKRQALARQGIDLSETRAEIRAAWKDGRAEAVRQAGYDIGPGRKSGVWIVSRDGSEIGSLDRIVGENRAAIRSAMEATPDQISRNESKSCAAQRIRKPAESGSQPAVGDPLSEKSERFRPERSGAMRPRDALAGRKKSGAELVSLEIGEQALQFAQGFRDRLDDRLAVASAHRWVETQRAALKSQILESSKSPADAEARRDVAQVRRELAVLDAAEAALGSDPSLASGGEKALMGAARRLHAEQTAATRNEIRDAWTAGGIAGVRAAGYEIAPGRVGNWRVYRGDAPIGRLHTLIEVDRSDIQRLMTDEISPAPATAAKAAAAADFLNQREPDLRSRIADLAKPDKLADPAELIATRKHLAASARTLAAWNAQHEKQISVLRDVTSAGRPESLLALLTGRTSRHDAAARELSKLYAEREPLLKPVAKMRREIKILETAQETRQAAHDTARRTELVRLQGELALLRDARAALAADPAIAQGGGKALADAARRHQRERELEQQRDADRQSFRSPTLRR